MRIVFSFITLRSSWLVTSTKRITSSMDVSRANTVVRVSGCTSLSKMKLRPVWREISSNTVRSGASRNSMVIGFVSAAFSLGVVAEREIALRRYLLVAQIVVAQLDVVRVFLHLLLEARETFLLVARLDLDARLSEVLVRTCREHEREGDQCQEFLHSGRLCLV